MHSLLVLLFLALLATTAVVAHGDHDHDHDHAEGPSDVVILDESNFDSEIKSADLALVEFFAPWCGHCKALAPEFKKAAKELEGKNAGALAAVDCTVERDLCNKYEVRGFPTLKLFRNDGSAPSDYDQARKADAIVKFMVKQNSPAVTKLESGAAVEEFQKDDNVRIVAFVNSGDDVAAFTKVAQALRNDYAFGIVTGDESAAATYKVAAPGVAVLRNFDEGNVAFPGSWTDADFEASLTKFIRAQSFPVVGEIGPENYQKYLERGFNFVWIFVNLDDADQKDMIANAVIPVATKNRDKLSFVKLDGVRWGEHAKSFGLSGNTPGVVIEDRKVNKNFIYDESKGVTAADFEAWIDQYLAGTLQPNVKSEPVPEKNDGPVKIIVGHTFEEIVMDDSKDVFVEFYAPWCGHCKTLSPKYDELGKMFAGSPDVVIAKVDATANDTPVEVQGFPTIKLFPAGNKKNVIEYDGDRSAKAMYDWLRQKGTKAASAPDAAASSDSDSDSHNHEEL